MMQSSMASRLSNPLCMMLKHSIAYLKDIPLILMTGELLCISYKKEEKPR